MKVCEDSMLTVEAIQLAEVLATGHFLANDAVRSLLLTIFINGLEIQMELESRLISGCVATENGQEGMRAFAQKRRPKYS